MAAHIRIRMYRPGFGDCFLLSFGPAGSARHVLVDFGVHHRGDIGTMAAIMADIETETEKQLEVVVASHAHRDHISGFGRFEDRFAAFAIREVWLPWTDNPQDADAARLRRKQLALYDQLDRHLRLALGAREGDPRFGAALDALSNLRGNEAATAALARGFGVATPRYLHAGNEIAKVENIAGLSAEILGPSRDPQFLSRMDPPANQRYLAGPGDTTSEVRPFRTLELKAASQQFRTLVKRDGQPALGSDDVAELHEQAEAPADRLALVLDSVRNNSSLVIVFRYRGKALLFPGDAQWGGWQSWIGTDNGRRVLGEVAFLKLGHHGSHNATPVDAVANLGASPVAVMASTQTRPFPTIPRRPLITALEKHAAGKLVVRSDWIKVAGAPRLKVPRKLPDGFEAGKLWIDYRL